MSPFAQAVEDYIQLRRGLGFKLRDCGDYLHKFVAFLEAQGSSHITTRLALDFATLRNHQKPVSWARQLGILRMFAIYRRNTDPRTEVPPVGILPFRSTGALPYLYSEEEIARLMEAAGAMESPYSLQPCTYRCLFGLLAVSGMRLGEALGLPRDAIDWCQSLLTIRGAKFGKSRLIPLHASTLTALRDYAELRDRKFAGRTVSYFFVTSCGTRLENSNVNSVFRTLSRKIGLRQPGATNGPRLHDLRHRFAIQTMLRWYREGDDVNRKLPVLSTYLGHAHVRSTYWYLSSSPELRVAAGKLLEARWEGVVP
jgi:integrase/recombinase XerD